MKILIADDDIVTRKLILKILKSLDHKFYESENGVSAYNSVISEQINILITDWMMPEMNGIELCQKIRANQDLHYVYIILVTAKTNREDAITGLKAGADDFIVKPIFPPELTARLNTSIRIIELQNQYQKTNMQLLQSDKMASIGQLAAGVAHEINNPTGFVSSNLNTLSEYSRDIHTLINKYRDLIRSYEISQTCDESMLKAIHDHENEMDLEFILQDFREIIKDCQEGTGRISKIVNDLKDFAHPGNDVISHADINQGLDSTLNVIWNEIKYKAEVIKKYSDLPLVQCHPQQLNQVFMNILLNAAQAIKDTGTITITTHSANDRVFIEIKDDGCGIKEEHLNRIFDPFFTTKEIGKGTGLGMNLAYKIIEKHKGKIDVRSNVNKGTVFTITIPVNIDDPEP